MSARRPGGPLTGLLTVAALSLSACAAPGGEAALEPGPSLSPAPRESYLALGSRLLEANEAALAMRAFATSLSVEGITPEALTGVGIAAQRQGMLGAARQHLEHARTLAPNSATAHQNLGMVLMMLKDYHGARTAFRSALLLTGDAPNETSRKGLERAEIAIAALEAGRYPDPAATQRVVRLGTDAFGIAERMDIGTEEGAAPESVTEQAGALNQGTPEEARATTEAGVERAAAGGPEAGPAPPTETEAGTGVVARVAGEAGNEAE